MSFKRPAIIMAAAALFAVAGSAAASAQENCGALYQRVMGAYQAQSPYYGQMLNHYNARCLSGSSMQPGWNGHERHWDDHDRRGHDNDRWGHDNDHRGDNNERLRQGW